MNKQILHSAYALIGEEQELKKDVIIKITDGYIDEISEYKYISPDDKENIIELGEMCILPGMFETHNHLALDARIPEHLEMMELSECEHTVLALDGLRDDLMSGVTTARCLGDRYYLDIKLKKLIEEKKVKGPDLLTSGIGMRSRTGHGYVGLPHDKLEDFVKTSKENILKGADILKIFVTPGMPVECEEVEVPCFLKYEEIEAVVREAKKAGIKTAAHCIGGIGLEYCIRAGVDVIEHLYSVTPKDLYLLENYFEGYVNLTSGIVLDEEREPYISEASVLKLRKARKYSRECLDRIYKNKKIKYTIGTDANHGLLYREFYYAKQAGVSNERIIKAVTSLAAKMSGLDNERGIIKEGYRADIIGVEHNPLDNIRELENIIFVMKKGEIYKRKES